MCKNSLGSCDNWDFFSHLIFIRIICSCFPFISTKYRCRYLLLLLTASIILFLIIYSMKCVYVCFRLKNKSSFLICNLHWLITFYELDFCKQCRLYIVFNVCYYLIAINKKKRTTSKWFETCQTQSTKRHLYVSLVYCLLI